MHKATQGLEGKIPDRSATWSEIVGWSSESAAQAACCPDALYHDVTFSPIDVIHWACDRHDLHTVSSTVWNFDQASYEKIAARGIREWRKVYGEDKVPYTWDGTEDEALGEELGAPPKPDYFGQYFIS